MGRHHDRAQAPNADRVRWAGRVRERVDPRPHERRPRTRQGAGCEAREEADAHGPSAARGDPAPRCWRADSGNRANLQRLAQHDFTAESMMTDSDDHPPEGVPLEVSHPHLGEFFDFLPELNKESDRGRVLISCSYLDELMRRILLAFVIDRDSSPRLFDGFNAPLGTFSTRTAAAYALGLITEREFNECESL